MLADISKHIWRQLWCWVPLMHATPSKPLCPNVTCMHACAYIYASNIGQAIGRYFTVVTILLVVYLIYPELQCRLQCRKAHIRYKGSTDARASSCLVLNRYKFLQWQYMPRVMSTQCSCLRRLACASWQNTSNKILRGPFASPHLSQKLPVNGVVQHMVQEPT